MHVSQVLIVWLLTLISFNLESVELIGSIYDMHILALSSSELIRIFTCKQIYWPSGNHITVFAKPSHSLEHREFVVDILNTSTLFVRQINNCVHVVSSDEDMVYNINNIPFSIGYINNTVTRNELQYISIIPYTR